MLFTPRPKGLGSENFLKLNDKQEVTGIFQGGIYTFRRHWLNNRGSECPGEGCQICAADPEKNYPSFRFRVNFITTKDGKWVAKIFEGGGETYDILTNLDRKFDLTKTVVEIGRSGLKQNTKYNVIPLTNYPITKEMDAMIKAVTLLALSSEEVEPGAEG